MDLTMWADKFNATGKAIMIENCHWGHTIPHPPSKLEPDGWCPWNFYRSSMDIRASYASVIHNLLTTVPFARHNLSYPGCWAYPDMLEVGCDHGPGGDHDPGLTEEETRSHFGSWCIVSSPLTLSHDVNNNTIMDAIWPVISNPEAIAINQAFAGHSGSPFKKDEKNRSAEVELTFGYLDSDHKNAYEKLKLPQWEYWYKPLKQGEKVAVLLMNYAKVTARLDLTLADVPGLYDICGSSGQCLIRNVWSRTDLGVFDYTTVYSAKDLGPHDAAFLTITDAAV
jgi:alpha-galactosidase